MSLQRAFRVLRKDLKVSPRSPVVFTAIILPIVLTLLIQLVLGTLFSPKPRLGIVDRGDSQITAEAQELEGIRVTLLDDADELRRQVEANDLDAGLILEENFDQQVRSGERPKLGFFIGGESQASNRIVLSVTTIDLIREVEGSKPPVDVQIYTVGEEVLPLATRLIPMIIYFALLYAGAVAPATSLVEEKENHTVDAILVTPVRMSELVLAKAAFGFFLAILMALVTLLINNALGSEPWALLAALGVSALMVSEISILLAAAAKDMNTMITIQKGVGFILFTPAVFYVWQDLPQWIPKIIPTYWILEMFFEIGIRGGGFAEIQLELAVALTIAVAALPLLGVLSRRMELRQAAGG